MIYLMVAVVVLVVGILEKWTRRSFNRYRHLRDKVRYRGFTMQV
jgi:hypothetical protein